MMITRKTVADRLAAYLHHEISLPELVDWAENAMMNGQFAPEHFDDIRDAVAQLGVSDVQAFGLTWEGCQRLLKKLGFSARVELRAT